MSDRPLPAHGTREAAREFIAQVARGAENHAAVISTYAEIGNDVGLLYAARCLRSYLKAMDAGIEEIERLRAVEIYRYRSGELGPTREAEGAQA